MLSPVEPANGSRQKAEYQLISIAAAALLKGGSVVRIAQHVAIEPHLYAQLHRLLKGLPVHTCSQLSDTAKNKGNSNRSSSSFMSICTVQHIKRSHKAPTWVSHLRIMGFRRVCAIYQCRTSGPQPSLNAPISRGVSLSHINTSISGATPNTVINRGALYVHGHVQR